MMILVTEIDIQ